MENVTMDSKTNLFQTKQEKLTELTTQQEKLKNYNLNWLFLNRR